MAGPTFGRPEQEAAFREAYAEAVSQWPAGTESLDLPTPYGRTHVHVCGPPAGPPLVLLHGGGGSSTVWFALARELAGRFRIYAPDRVAEAGLSESATAAPDPLAWLDSVLDGLGLHRTHLAGHSYGGWQAFTYALSRPERVDHLALLDPSDVFAPMAPGYLLRGVPTLFLRFPRVLDSLLTWETRGRPLDPATRRLALAAQAGRMPSPVMPRRPAEPERLAVPTLVLVAARSRSHDPARLRARADRLPRVTTALLPDATHHTLPTEDAGQVAAALRSFFP
ncbi:pimeloyl-ACP methyl ester carboxylesterase [Catenuloplanes nepalensis]|uniref:Pimeloyl-ACP methyl ester carboxylesterase n=1 Tax=Catenuloplanes nepalensis TaxID=587533 RepID=A0ABT9N776_9ACTN|nr:alpha/beta hydrolase [Catenuloplanes nepalensis]MDP9799550.1 pimeloyl-ACP methyl ester carboxylesterase [Catenuloplanes nepalensis]